MLVSNKYKPREENKYSQNLGNSLASLSCWNLIFMIKSKISYDSLIECKSNKGKNPECNDLFQTRSPQDTVKSPKALHTTVNTSTIGKLNCTGAVIKYNLNFYAL